MIACLCSCITDEEIEEAIKRGASSIEQLRLKLDVCNYCMCCEAHILAIIHTHDGSDDNN